MAGTKVRPGDNSGRVIPGITTGQTGLRRQQKTRKAINLAGFLEASGILETAIWW